MQKACDFIIYVRFIIELTVRNVYLCIILENTLKFYRTVQVNELTKHSCHFNTLTMKHIYACAHSLIVKI